MDVWIESIVGMAGIGGGTGSGNRGRYEGALRWMRGYWVLLGWTRGQRVCLDG